MNKALEALKIIGSFEAMRLPMGSVILVEDTAEYATIKQALTPPTEEEVCEALSKHHGGENVVYENGNFYVVGDSWREVIVVSMKDNNGNYVIDFCGDTFPPHLVIMIGRFYEGGGELK